MSREIKWLSQEMGAFIEEAERARKVLHSYIRVSAQLVRRVENGELLVDVLEDLEGPLRRREVTEAIAELGVARHRVRLAMFAVGMSQETTFSELGRKLGISRQLASRLASEAAETFGDGTLYR